MSWIRKGTGATALALCATLFAADAAAFCGTFVAGTDAEMFNSATQVVLMRSGERTVLSMENDYEGPVQEFAMVVPVPVILQQEDVKTLDPIVFRKVDVLGTPRLVEYAEKDPCQDRYYTTYDYIGGCPWDNYGWADSDGAQNNFNEAPSQDAGGGPPPDPSPPPVIEAEFAVGEYEIKILSAEDATGLQTWLDANGYSIGTEAIGVLEGYIQQGMYFFVAEVDPEKVTFEEGRAVLSPLRFSYTSQDFSLPIRLGLLNSAGQQDLIVNILSTEGRYEVANYPNAYIPTNKLVSQDTREAFPAFYEKLFAQTMAQNPGAVVTEYAWSWGGLQRGNKCDPCPPPPEGATGSLDDADLAALGNDIVAGELDPEETWYGWNLTRLHARYGKTGIDNDLVFSLKGTLTGGAGTSGRAQSETTAEDTFVAGRQSNQFQGRYIMHNVWPEEVTCQDPVRGRWIGTGEVGAAPGPTSGGAPADVPGMSVDDFYVPATDIPETGQPKRIVETIDQGPCEEPAPDWWTGEDPPRAGGGDSTTDADREEGGGCAAAGETAPLGVALAFGLSGLVGVARRRRRDA
jgi:MYXO-CTERM domain-containing protein